MSQIFSNMSEPHEVEDSIKDISEKELSHLNKSHPDDKVVENSRIVRPPRPAGSSVSKNKSDNGGIQHSADRKDRIIDKKWQKPEKFAIFSGNQQIDEVQDFEDAEKDDNDSLQEKIDQNFNINRINFKNQSLNKLSGQVTQKSSQQGGFEKEKPYQSAKKIEPHKKVNQVTFQTNPTPRQDLLDGEDSEPQKAEEAFRRLERQLEEDERMVSDFQRQLIASKGDQTADN